MEIITKEEFLKRLKEDKYFEKPEEIIEYRVPVVQYYLTNHPIKIVTNIEAFDTSKIELQRSHSETELQLVSWAFQCIKEKLIPKK